MVVRNITTKVRQHPPYITKKHLKLRGEHSSNDSPFKSPTIKKIISIALYRLCYKRKVIANSD